MSLLNTATPYGQLFHIDFIDTNLFACSCVYFLRYYGKFVSIWLTVAITVERYVIIAHPLRVKTISTRRTTNCVISAIYVIGAALNAYPFWVLKIVQFSDFSLCQVGKRVSYAHWSWAIYRVGSLALPCLLTAIFTILIVVCLRRNQDTRHGMVSSGPEVDGAGTMQRQLTRMLVTVAAVALVLNLPYTIIYIPFDNRYDYWGYEFENTWSEFYLNVARDVCYVIVAVNYMINFFLFCLTGSVFRKNLVACLLCRKADVRTGCVAGSRNTATSVLKSSVYSTPLLKTRQANANLKLNSSTPQDSPQPTRLKE